MRSRAGIGKHTDCAVFVMLREVPVTWEYMACRTTLISFIWRTRGWGVGRGEGDGEDGALGWGVGGWRILDKWD